MESCTAELNSQWSHSSAATDLRDDLLNSSFPWSSFLNLISQEILQLVHICQGYRPKSNSMLPFLAHMVIILTRITTAHAIKVD